MNYMKNKSYLYIFIVLCSAIFVSCKPQMSKEIENTIKKIGSFHYEPGDRYYPDQNSDIEHLAKITNMQQLTYLEENDPLPMIRYAAFIGIMHKHPKVAKEIAINKITEKSAIATLFPFCHFSYNIEAISSLRIKKLMEEGKKYGLTAKDSMEIDSVVLYTPNLKHIPYLDILLQKLPPKEKYYQRVRELFLKEHNLSALRALARYNNPENYPFILKAISGKVPDQNYVKENIQRQEKEIEEMRETDIDSGTRNPKQLIWVYDCMDDYYNISEYVKDVGLECVCECPVSAFKTYWNEARIYCEEYKKNRFLWYTAADDIPILKKIPFTKELQKLLVEKKKREEQQKRIDMEGPQEENVNKDSGSDSIPIYIKR